MRAVMMVLHKVFGIVGGALNGAKGVHACHPDTLYAAGHPAASSLVSSPTIQKRWLYQRGLDHDAGTCPAMAQADRCQRRVPRRLGDGPEAHLSGVTDAGDERGSQGADALAQQGMFTSCARAMAAWCIKWSCEPSTRAGLQDPEKWKDAIGGPTGEPLTGTLLKTVGPPAAYCLQ